MDTHEAINILRNTAWLGTNGDREKTEQAIEVVAEVLEQEPKRGKWIDVSGRGSWEIKNACDQCGKIVFQSDFNYCPNCGAKMGSDTE